MGEMDSGSARQKDGQTERYIQTEGEGGIVGGWGKERDIGRGERGERKRGREGRERERERVGRERGER